jgi:phosphoenolpyruvate-protein kinase (PTS system EI component)
MGEQISQGLPASPGLAVGPALVLDARAPAAAATVPGEAREEEAERASEALVAAATQLEALAATLAGQGRTDEAEIVQTGALMALDPGLAADVERLTGEGVPAPAALLAATEIHAEALAAIPDPTLAARADDVRSLGRRAARFAEGEAAPARDGAPAGACVVVATDLGPADVAEVCDIACAFALAAGGPTAHAAIVARSLGLPMVTGLGDDILRVPGGEQLVVDGEAGTVAASPSPARLDAAADATRRRAAARRRAAETRGVAAETRDGQRVAVLANVAAAPEVAVALEAGADGVGLVRTELALLTARGWPTEAEHMRALGPVLGPLRGLPVTVRVLDYGGDKLPPFLDGERERGTALLLRHPEALAAQLRAILAVGADTQLRIMLPLVEAVEEIEAVRALLPDDARLGAMVETPTAAAAASRLAAASDFLSIGTNDLTASTLGLDRFAAGQAPAHDPRVLALVAQTAAAAQEAGVPLEVCGEAASDPIMLPLLVGLGVREVSVGAARLGTVRGWVRALDAAECHALAQRALAAPDAATVAAIAGPVAERLRAAERDDAEPQRPQPDRIAVAPRP